MDAGRRHHCLNPSNLRHRFVIQRIQPIVLISARDWHRIARHPGFMAAAACWSSEEAFRREIFHRDTADRPAIILSGRVTDDAGRRIDGAKIRVWFQGTAIADEVSGKDGGFRIRLPSTAIPYTIRISHAGQATEIADVRLDKPPAPVRTFHLGPESTFKGRVVDVAGAPVPRVAIRALRSPEDVVEVSAGQTGDDGQFLITGLENKRYVLVASRFGWQPGAVRAAVAPGCPARDDPSRSHRRDSRNRRRRGRRCRAPRHRGRHVVRGIWLSSSPIIWTTDADGKFAQDRFGPGTYYLWARHGEMLVYPPEKIELGEGHLDVEAELKVSHRGAHVRGHIAASPGFPLDVETRAVLVGRSPLAFPRKAVGEVDKAGGFVIAGVLPGRYELSVRVGPRVLTITSGPREVEIPIEEGADVDLPEPVVVRPRAEE